jgi:Protein of unknown function (DUF551)
MKGISMNRGLTKLERKCNICRKNACNYCGRYPCAWSQWEGLWINVEDELPELGQSVLIWTDSGICIANMCNKTTAENKSIWKVTHWMPLPKPPEE